jgi:hypothetical protein
MTRGRYSKMRLALAGLLAAAALAPVALAQTQPETPPPPHPRRSDPGRPGHGAARRNGDPSAVGGP